MTSSVRYELSKLTQSPPLLKRKDKRRLSPLLGDLIKQALTAQAGAKAFRLAPLPYDYSGLEPVIDRQTLHWHHDIHHRNYVDKLNQATLGQVVRGMGLEEILSSVSRFSPAVREYGGAHFNHTLFWSLLTDNLEDHEISTEVHSAIARDFISFDDFKHKFIKVGMNHSGPGWLWLIKNSSERLEIVVTDGHDSPLMDIAEVEVKGSPLLLCDLWEHDFFQKPRSPREDYLRKFFTIINWRRVNALFIGEYH